MWENRKEREMERERERDRNPPQNNKKTMEVQTRMKMKAITWLIAKVLAPFSFQLKIWPETHLGRMTLQPCPPAHLIAISVTSFSCKCDSPPLSLNENARGTRRFSTRTFTITWYVLAYRTACLLPKTKGDEGRMGNCDKSVKKYNSHYPLISVIKVNKSSVK